MINPEPHWKHGKCRLCRSSLLQCVITLKPIPVGEHYTQEPLMFEAPRYPIDIYQCTKCGAVQTQDNINPEILWSSYTYYSGMTESIVRHFEQFFNDTMARYKFKSNSSILDIGSNDGSLLSIFDRYGWETLGVDPAKTVANVAISKGISTLVGLYGSDQIDRKLTGHSFDLITAFNVFAHSNSMDCMLSSVKKHLSPAGIFSFEVQYLLDISKKVILGTFFHEHMIHYSLHAIINFLQSGGLKVIGYSRNNIQNGSLIVYATHRECSLHDDVESLSSLNELINLEIKEGIHNSSWSYPFILNVNRSIRACHDFLEAAKVPKKSIVGYGAARSGPLLTIQYVLEEYLCFLVDDHPAKCGKFAPLASLEVLPTKILDATKNPLALILAYIHWKPIIQNNIRYLDAGGCFLILWPCFKVINKKNYSLALHE